MKLKTTTNGREKTTTNLWFENTKDTKGKRTLPETVRDKSYQVS
jgi:hypothetical protein